MSEKYISVETAVALAMQYCPDDDGVCSKAGHDLRELLDDLENTAPADVRPVVREAWEQREVFDARGNVYELQSAFCPVCKRYHTTPYLYSFTHYDYCPNCGAKMDEIEKSIDAHAKRGRCGRADITGGADG